MVYPRIILSFYTSCIMRLFDLSYVLIQKSHIMSHTQSMAERLKVAYQTYHDKRKEVQRNWYTNIKDVCWYACELSEENSFDITTPVLIDAVMKPYSKKVENSHYRFAYRIYQDATCNGYMLTDEPDPIDKGYTLLQAKRGTLRRASESSIGTMDLCKVDEFTDIAQLIYDINCEVGSILMNADQMIEELSTAHERMSNPLKISDQ